MKYDYKGDCDGDLAGCCEHSNETPGSVRCGDFLNWLLLMASHKQLFSIQLVRNIIIKILTTNPYRPTDLTVILIFATK
jgi:hypothetical protein